MTVVCATWSAKQAEVETAVKVRESRKEHLLAIVDRTRVSATFRDG
jgi:hypothetical protein